MSAFLQVLGQRLDATRLFRAATGCDPDDWQQQLLRSSARQIIVNASRQIGKSTCVATLALHTALFVPGSLTLLVAPAERQSAELFAKVIDQYLALGEPIAADKATMLELKLANKSRIVALPANERTIRGYSGVTLLVVDEAARIRDDDIYGARPMLAVSGGRMVALSTPWGKRGWFHSAWNAGDAWQRFEVPATACRRIDPRFLTGERATLGEAWFQQEYMCSFEDSGAQVFAGSLIASMISDEVETVDLGELLGIPTMSMSAPAVSEMAF